MPKTTKGKVAVIGAGFVGVTSAYALMNAGTASEIVLVDIDRDKLEGEVLDLDHGIMFVPPVRIRAGDYEECSDAEVVVLTAGANQKPGESRLDLLKKNVKDFAGNGAVMMGGHGAPPAIHGGPSGADLRAVKPDFFPAVVYNFACLTGCVSRSYEWIRDRAEARPVFPHSEDDA